MRRYLTRTTMKLRTLRRFCVIFAVLLLICYAYMHYLSYRDENLSALQQTVSKFDVNIETFERLNWFYSRDLSKINDEINYTISVTPHTTTTTTTTTSTTSTTIREQFVKINTKSSVCSYSVKWINTSLQMPIIYNEIKFTNDNGGAWTQGFPITYNLASEWADRPLEVFIVPHSHQDPGWILTVDEYFKQKVKLSLDASLTTLHRRKEARFVYAEIAYFSMWYDALADQEKNVLKSLLHTGQWEIVSGGWVMPDEATTHYSAILDQLIEGHHWLLENLDYRPNISWSIDPFGQSTTMAYLAKRVGFSSMVINRVHYEVKKYLALKKSLEFYWLQNWDADPSSGIFAHMFPFYSYDVPHTCGPEPAICCQFDFIRMKNYGCPWGKNPVIINEYNIDERAKLLADQFRKKSKLYNNGDLVLVPLGDDFRYLSTKEWDLQLDNYNKLIDYLNSKPEFRIKIKFATLTDYMDAVTERVAQKNVKFPTFSGDLFTYADRNQDYWSGYFTSRPFQKRLSRIAETELRTAEILYTFARQHIGRNRQSANLHNAIDGLYPRLVSARRNMAVFQHHDGITGTSKPHVVEDYSLRLLHAIDVLRQLSTICTLYLLMFPYPMGQAQGFNKVKELHTLKIFQQLVAKTGPNYRSYDLHNSRNSRQNITQLFDNQDYLIHSIEDHLHLHSLAEPNPIFVEWGSEKVKSYVYLFNPSTYRRTSIISLYVDAGVESYSVYQLKWRNETQIKLRQQIVTQAPHKANSTTLLYIGPVEFDPLSIQFVELVKHSDVSMGRSSTTTNTTTTTRENVNTTYTTVQTFDLTRPNFTRPNITMENSCLRLEFDSNTGYLKSVYEKQSNRVYSVQVDFIQYGSMSGDSTSGAYLFIPDGPGRPMDSPTTMQHSTGDLVDEVTVYTRFVNHTIRLYKSVGPQSKSFEMETIVNLISDGSVDIDLALRLQTNLTNTGRVFYTDSNCFQFIQRRYYDKLPLQGNIYPLACGVYIEDDEGAGQRTVFNQSDILHNTRLNLFVNHPLGVTSPQLGTLNIWLDRRSKRDDSRGLFKSLSGSWISKSTFRVLIEVIPFKSTKAGQPVHSGLTLNAQHSLYEFTRPIHRFCYMHKTSPSSESSINSAQIIQPTPLNLISKQGFPCDYELVNLRTMQSSKLPATVHAAPGTQIGLIVRRLARYHCPTTNTKFPITDGLLGTCDFSQNGYLNLSMLFGQYLEISAAIHTNLTLIPSKVATSAELLVPANIFIHPMELGAFYLV